MSLPVEQQLGPYEEFGIPEDRYRLSQLAPFYQKYYLKMEVKPEALNGAFEKLKAITVQARHGVGVKVLYEDSGLGGTLEEFTLGVRMADLVHTAVLNRQGGGEEIMEKLEMIDKWTWEAQQWPDASLRSMEGWEEMDRLINFTWSNPDWYKRK